MKQSSLPHSDDSGDDNIISFARAAYVESLRVQYLQGTLRATLLESGAPLPPGLLSALLPQVFPDGTLCS